MYRDDIQLYDIKECFWYDLHALTIMANSALDVLPTFPDPCLCVAGVLLKSSRMNGT